MTPFIGNVQKRGLYREGQQMGGCQELVRGMGSDCLMGVELLFEVLKCFGVTQTKCLCNTENILHATELFTLKWLALRYMNFTWIKIHRERGTWLVQ